MNILYLISSMLLLVLGIGHTLLGEWIGERVLVKKSVGFSYFPDDRAKDALSKRIIRIAWHSTSITWCGLAAIVLYLSFLPSDAVSKSVICIISATMIVISIVATLTVRFRNTKGVLFLIIGILLFLGSMIQ